MFKVIVDRDTSQVLNLEIAALDEAEATNKAIEVASNVETEWEESDFLGDPVVTFIEQMNNESDAVENQELETQILNMATYHQGAWSFIRGLIDGGESDYEKIKRVISEMDLLPENCYYMDRPVIEGAMPELFNFCN